MNTIKKEVVLLKFKLILVLPVIVVFLIVQASCKRGKDWEATLSKIAPPPIPPSAHNIPTMEGKDTIWLITDEVPLFPGGDELLARYISKHIIYPKNALEKGIQGQVILRFCISSKGVVSDHEIIEGIDPDLDAEAIRVVKSLTRFEPARIDGNPVASWYYLPISFKLN